MDFAVCVTVIYEDEWVLCDGIYLKSELRHFATEGILRLSELKILQASLESGELDYFWNSKFDTEVNVTAAIKKLCIFKIILIKIKGFCYKIYIWLSKNNWHISKNRNFYNQQLGLQFTNGVQIGILLAITFITKAINQKLVLCKLHLKCGYRKSKIIK